MKRKGIWLAGLAVAGLLALAPDAPAGGRVGYLGGPRHHVIAVHPGWFRAAGHRAWYGGHYGWEPAGWFVRHPGYFRHDGGWRFRHRDRAFYGRGWYRR